MNQQELVEAVIKEVRRVLALRGVQISPSPEASPSATPSPAAPPRMAPAPVYSGGAYGADTDLTGKQVIVLKDIQSVSGGSVRVARNAVITPMAIDYAREKGITLERVETPEKKEASGSVPSTLVGLTVKSDFQGNAAMVKNFLSAHGIQVREFTGQSYETAVQNLSSGVASGAVHFGLCLENSGMLGPIDRR